MYTFTIISTYREEKLNVNRTNNMSSIVLVVWEVKVGVTRNVHVEFGDCRFPSSRYIKIFYLQRFRMSTLLHLYLSIISS